jgi:adenine-specific DNA-methyltransferase
MDPFVHQSMLTCIGNKRKLVAHIDGIIEELFPGRTDLTLVDGFAGSSVVSRTLSRFASTLYTNDLELYAYLMAKACLDTPTTSQQERIRVHIQAMNRLAETGPYVEGLVSRLYAPRRTDAVQEGERCFYTRENALIIDTLRDYIARSVEPDLHPYCLSPLLTKASIHTNTAGVFKGFYKDGEGIGCFGGAGKNALERILKPIRVEVPVWSSHSFKSSCSQMDILELLKRLEGPVDLMYFDPPYNQHPYGSNYFMLNVIARNEEPAELSKVSGIPKDWNRSAYNARASALVAMQELLGVGLQKARYLLISYNNEGILTAEDWAGLLGPYRVRIYEIDYDAFKGSRNLAQRPDKVVEILYLVSLV